MDVANCVSHIQFQSGPLTIVESDLQVRGRLRFIDLWSSVRRILVYSSTCDYRPTQASTSSCVSHILLFFRLGLFFLFATIFVEPVIRSRNFLLSFTNHLFNRRNVFLLTFSLEVCMLGVLSMDIALC